jgi:hypothetical protein
MADRYDAWGDYHAYVQEEKNKRAIQSRFEDEDRNREYEEYRRRAVERFPDFATMQRNHDWGVSLLNRAQVLDGITKSEDAVLLLEEHKALSNHVHVNSLSIRSRVQEDDSGIHVGKKYTSAQIASTLFAVNDALFYLSALLDELYWERNHEKVWYDSFFKWRPYLKGLLGEDVS